MDATPASARSQLPYLYKAKYATEGTENTENTEHAPDIRYGTRNGC